MRSRLLSGLLNGYKAKNIGAAQADVIKTLFKENYLNYKKYTPVPVYIFSGVKGISDTASMYVNENVNKNIREMAKELPPGRWITFSNLLSYLRTRLTDIRPFEGWYIYNKLFYEKTDDRYGYQQKHYVQPSEFRILIDEPYLKGNLYLLAAWGLMEIAYIHSEQGIFGKNWFSEYDGIHAVRLTDLGAYVLELQKEYKPIVATEQNKLILEENALILRAEGNMELVNSMLDGFMEKVSGNRYSFNAGSFLKDCNKELHRLLAQDKMVKELVLKAEKFHVAVTADNYSQFCRRMATLGYLVGK